MSMNRDHFSGNRCQNAIEMVNDDSLTFLEGLLGKTLHITTADERLLTGTFKCTDNESNIILSTTHEYRRPSAKEEARAIDQAGQESTPVRANMTSRFVGLITIGTSQIRKIELEERKTLAIPTRPKT